jgi:hypothetical protein
VCQRAHATKYQDLVKRHAATPSEQRESGGRRRRIHPPGATPATPRHGCAPQGREEGAASAPGWVAAGSVVAGRAVPRAPGSVLRALRARLRLRPGRRPAGARGTARVGPTARGWSRWEGAAPVPGWVAVGWVVAGRAVPRAPGSVLRALRARLRLRPGRRPAGARGTAWVGPTARGWSRWEGAAPVPGWVAAGSVVAGRAVPRAPGAGFVSPRRRGGAEPLASVGVEPYL